MARVQQPKQTLTRAGRGDRYCSRCPAIDSADTSHDASCAPTLRGIAVSPWKYSLTLGLAACSTILAPASRGARSEIDADLPTQCRAIPRFDNARVLRSTFGSARLYVEPDQVFETRRGTVIVGSSGLAHSGSASNRRPIAGVSVLSDSTTDAIEMPPGALGHKVVRGLQRVDTIELVTSADNGAPSEREFRYSRMVAGRWTLMASSTIPVRVAHHSDPTALVAAPRGAWLAVPIPGARGIHWAGVLRFTGDAIKIDSIPLLGRPAFLASIPDGRSETKSLVYSTSRLVGHTFQAPGLAVTTWDPRDGTVSHRLITGGGVETQPGPTVVLVDGSRWTVLWLEALAGSYSNSRVAGVESRDRGKNWRRMPDLELPSALVSLHAARMRGDSVMIAGAVGPGRRAVLVALLTESGWSRAHTVERDAPVSSPVIATRREGGFRIVFGTVDGPIRVTLPALHAIVGEWGCEERTR